MCLSLATAAGIHKPIAYGYDAPGPLCQLPVMSHNYDGDTLTVQLIEEPIDPVRGDRVEVSW